MHHCEEKLVLVALVLPKIQFPVRFCHSISFILMKREILVRIVTACVFFSV